MKINSISKAFLKLSKVYELHHVPGRLRVKIPGLEHAKGMFDQKEMDDIFQSYKLKGVELVEVSFVTSKMLIIYDVSKTNKTTIIAFLNLLRKKMFKLFQTIDESKTDKNLEILFEELMKEGYDIERK